jgi:hypothetical protein
LKPPSKRLPDKEARIKPELPLKQISSDEADKSAVPKKMSPG